MRHMRVIAAAAMIALAGGAYSLGASQGPDAGSARAAKARGTGLWKVYNRMLRRARYIDLTHAVTPHSPVWKGFGPSRFKPAVNPDTGKPYTYATDGFEAT